MHVVDSGLYYLQSRYYDPELGRFLNADSYASTGQGIIGCNMFVYCLNSPAGYIDITGNTARFLTFCCIYDGSGSGEKTIVDLTDILNEFMRENAKILQEFYDEHSYASSLIFFYNNVKDGGALDIKLQEDWKFEEGKSYYYNGIELRYDDPGNINFGYVGAVLFSEGTLCFGAGVNQISKFGFQFGDLSTFYDDPRDNEMIKLGYSKYWEDH